MRSDGSKSRYLHPFSVMMEVCIFYREMISRNYLVHENPINMPLLSICIPTYNRKKCLQQCIDSIVEQSVFSELEIVVSDNGSNDGTEEMMSGYVAKYPNIVYSRNPENL